MSLELMLNAQRIYRSSPSRDFTSSPAEFRDTTRKVFVFFIITVGAAEVAVASPFIVALFRRTTNHAR